MSKMIDEIAKVLEDSRTLAVTVSEASAATDYFAGSTGYLGGGTQGRRYILQADGWYQDGVKCAPLSDSPDEVFTICSGPLISRRQAQAVVDQIHGLEKAGIEAGAYALFATDKGMDSIDPRARQAWEEYGEKGREEYRDKARNVMLAAKETAK